MRRGKCILIQDLHIQLIRDSVPVIVAFTKFDQAVLNESGGSVGGSPRSRVEQLCRSLFHSELRDVPAEIVSGGCPLFCGTVL